MPARESKNAQSYVPDSGCGRADQSEKRRQAGAGKRGTTRGTNVEQNRRKQGGIRGISAQLNH